MTPTLCGHRPLSSLETKFAQVCVTVHIPSVTQNTRDSEKHEAPGIFQENSAQALQSEALGCSASVNQGGLNSMTVSTNKAINVHAGSKTGRGLIWMSTLAVPIAASACGTQANSSLYAQMDTASHALTDASPEQNAEGMTCEKTYKKEQEVCEEVITTKKQCRKQVDPELQEKSEAVLASFLDFGFQSPAPNGYLWDCTR